MRVPTNELKRKNSVFALNLNTVEGLGQACSTRWYEPAQFATQWDSATMYISIDSLRNRSTNSPPLSSNPGIKMTCL